MATGGKPHWTADRVDQRLSELGPAHAHPASEEQIDPLLWSYVDAASVLSSFDPEELRPLNDDAPRVEALRRLLEESTPVFDVEGHARWRLAAPSRRVALERLGARERILQACRRNPSEHDGLERAFVQILEGRAGSLSSRRIAELPRLLEAAEALEGIVEVPDVQSIERALERAALFEPLFALVGTRFRGRERELAQLRDYVGLDSPRRPRLFRLLFRARRAQPSPHPLLVQGVGGIGKSTLLAKLILDHAEDQRSLVFAYLDFDRPAITAADPSSIVLEVARQLAVQSAGSTREAWVNFTDLWTKRLSEIRRGSASTLAAGESQSGSEQALDALITAFAKQYEASLNGARPLLLVLDSFEEVQYRSAAQVKVVWALLERLRLQVPVLRAILAGRAPIDGHQTDSLVLSVLDEEAAAGFLEAHGISDPETSSMLISRFGTSPLTLSLAADLVRREGSGDEALKSLSRRQRLGVFSVDHEAAQVELYRRLLRHLHDRDVQRLAHPGLVLRRITPELIKEVLAGPCEIAVPSMETARELFEKLRGEITLVRTADDGALEHRADVRRAMLPMLRETEPRAVAAIHASAIAYFAARDGVGERAEEIYHRLAAGEDPVQVDERWIDGVEDRLRGAVGELPPRAQSYVAARTGVEIDPKMWKLASQEDTELRAEIRGAELLALGRPHEALEVLAPVKQRANASRVSLREAEAYRELGEFERAIATIDETLNAVPGRGAREAARDLLALAASVESSMGRREEAAARIDEAYVVARWLENPGLLLETGAARLQLRRAARKRDQRRYRSALREVQEDLNRLGAGALAGQPAAAHRLAAELGAQYPQELVRIAEAAGLPQLRVTRVRRALVLWNRELRGSLSSDAAAQRLIAGTEDMSPAGAMDVLLGLLSRQELTPGAAGSIASEIRQTLAQAAGSRGEWFDEEDEDES